MSKNQRAPRSTPGSTSKSTPRTPRLSSPPAAASAGSNRPQANTSRKADQSQSAPPTPALVVERQGLGLSLDGEGKDDIAQSRSGVRTPTRGVNGSGAPLETVQESSNPSTPSSENTKASDKAKAAHERPSRIEENPMEEAFAQGIKSRPESGNESTGGKNSGKKTGDDAKEGWKPTSTATSSKPPAIHSKKSYTQLPNKLKTASEGSVKNMTVETETVSSVPQVAVGGGTGERSAPGRSDTGGSIRLKPSTETIRPKKDKKKVVRKTTSLGAGAGGFPSRHFLRQHISRYPSPELLSSSLDSPKLLDDITTVENSSTSSLRLESPSEPTRSGRSSFSSTRPAVTPSRKFSFGLMSFRSRTASSKADIFEAKVASAVGEADSSDSEETFVYESNPPEPHSARAHKFHSRTPSTASTWSQIDHPGDRSRQHSHHAVIKRKSMKFANYNSINSPEYENPVRGPTGGSGIRQVARVSRPAGHASIFDKESPFADGSKPPRTAAAQLQQFASRQNRQRSPQMRFSGNGRKAEEILSYDLEGEGADDERAPLIGSMRSGRNRRRPLPGSVRQVYAGGNRTGRGCGRLAAFISLGSVLALLIAAIVIILVLCTKTLFGVQVLDIRNVLASESEIMLDLEVQAVNPNIIAITIADLDLNVFAKSRHVGTSFIPSPLHPAIPHNQILPKSTPPDSDTKVDLTIASASHHHHPSILEDPEDIIDHLTSGVDKGTDPLPQPPSDPASDSQTMLLGRIFTFDSPLIFDASPLHHRPSSSTGSVRLSRPGNTTEEGGSARWERVLQHDFELIVRGVVKYSLPISSKVRSASVGGKVVVHPDAEDEGSKEGEMGLSRPKGREGVGRGSNVVVEQPAVRKQGVVWKRRGRKE